MSSSAGAATPVSANLPTEKPSRYRWVVMATIFAAYVVCMADRANIGAVHRWVYAADGTRKPFVSGYSNTTLPNLWDRSKEGA